jgi:hypothetical protein
MEIRKLKKNNIFEEENEEPIVDDRLKTSKISFKLLKNDPCLDLRDKSIPIRFTLNHIANEYNYYLLHYSNLSVEKDSFSIDVKENGDLWHSKVGYILKKDYGMVDFCILKDDMEYVMFDVIYLNKAGL